MMTVIISIISVHGRFHDNNTYNNNIMCSTSTWWVMCGLYSILYPISPRALTDHRCTDSLALSCFLTYCRFNKPALERARELGACYPLEL
jgi:hypothetical protein